MSEFKIVLRIDDTPTGVKCEWRDYRALADGRFVNSQTRYFYGENPLDDAAAYARRKVDEDPETFEIKAGHGIEISDRRDGGDAA